jgi:hypothetical protein
MGWVQGESAWNIDLSVENLTVAMQHFVQDMRDSQ